MYKLAPPKGSTEWSFGLMIDFCIRVGLGKKGTGSQGWTNEGIAEHLGISSIRPWKTEAGTSSSSLKKFITEIVRAENYAEEWELVVRHSFQKINSSKEIEAERKKFFKTETFSKGNYRKLIREYIENNVVLSLGEIEAAIELQRPKPKQKTESIRTKITFAIGPRFMILGFGVITAIGLAWFIYNAPTRPTQVGDPDPKLEGVNLNNLIIKNIQFCKEENFDHALNACLKNSDIFEYGIKKINISFDSDKIQNSTTLNMRWYRYGEKFTESFQRWSDAFAIKRKGDIEDKRRYASTYIARPIEAFTGKEIDLGRYHVRFYLDKVLIDEASFNVK